MCFFILIKKANNILFVHILIYIKILYNAFKQNIFKLYLIDSI